MVDHDLFEGSDIIYITLRKQYTTVAMEGNHKSAGSVFKFTLNEARSLRMEGDWESHLAGITKGKEKWKKGSQIAVFPRPPLALLWTQP